LTTKFSVRPAVRHRPWICKRSPPCLEPNPNPPSVLCTFSLNRYQPPPPLETYSGTFTLLRVLPGALYTGTWSNASDWFWCQFQYTGTPTIARVDVRWDLGGHHVMDTFPDKEITFPPSIWYEAFTLEVNWNTWNGTVLITG